MKQDIQVFDYAGDICRRMSGGILLTAAGDGRVNTMTIGWGTIGIEWGKPIFVAYIRESRYTLELLQKSGEFTVSIPNDDTDKSIIGFCGTKSGRDVDKFAALGLHTESARHVSAPAIRELPLTLECRVLRSGMQAPDALPPEILARYYPADAQGKRDRHIAFYGEIVDAYLITP